MVIITNNRKSLLKTNSDPALTPNLDSGRKHLTVPDATTTTSPASCPEGKKSVRFATKKQIFYHHRKQERPTSLKSRWYTDVQFSTFRSQYMEEAKKIAKPETTSNEAQIVHQVFQKCAKGELLDVEMFGKLKSYLNDETNIRSGLERFASKELFRDKKQRRRDQYLAVMDVEELNIHLEAKAELLRVACEKISRPSVAFARHIAYAAVAK